MRYPVFVLLLACAFSAAGQSYKIKGSVTDTLNAAKLFRASVVVIRTSDSVIESYTRTDPNGTFELKVAQKGKYLLRITFPGFVDYLEKLDVKKDLTDLGDLPMVSKEHLLKEFVLTKNIAAIKIKGDTTEYMADSFKVKENATVEDLLKKLPGIQVDKDGNITAQGETVQKILVDGEEFFSDDPKVVTQGLQANAVEKVQVYNKKSDQAEFTGIDDGQKTKTINLELKEDKKKGYFGKVDAGAGTDGYYQEQGMINAFKAKRQFSAFGIAANTDKIGLGWQDNDKFGSGNGVTTITDEGISTTYTSNSDQDLGGWDGKYNGQGLPQTWTGGMHFADKWNEDKDHVTANYRYGNQQVNIVGTTTTQNVLPGNSGFVSDQTKTQSSKIERHGFDVMYERKIDSNTTLKLTADGGYKQSQTLSDYNTNTLTSESTPLNLNRRKISSNAYANFVNSDLLLRHKFKKKGRTISVDVKENYKDSKSDGFLNSTTNFFVDSAGHTDTIPIPPTYVAQEKKTNTNTLAFSAKATYTEPLSKKVYLELDYGVTVNNSLSDNRSFNSTTPGRYSDTLDSTYSSNFRYNILSNTGGVNFKFVYDKVNFSFGSDVSNAAYNQEDLLHGDTSSRYSYFNVFPKASITYKPGKQTSINFFYQGSTQQPSITQIAPLKQNTDPLNITIGNPDLKQQFMNRFTLSFNDYKVLSGRYMYGNLSFTTISDAISTKNTVFDGVNQTQYINVNGNYNGWGYFGGGMKLQKSGLYLGLQLSSALSHSLNILNTYDSVKRIFSNNNNTNNNNRYSITPYINYDKENKFDFSIDPSVTYNDNHSTVSTFSSSYWSFDLNFSGTVQLPKKFEIGSSGDIMIREKTAVFTTNNNVVKWNAFVGKKFLKKSQLEVKLSVFDILNQNIGFDRTATAGVITENNYNTIRRYGMLQLVWNFTHTPAGAPQPQQGTMIISH